MEQSDDHAPPNTGVEPFEPLPPTFDGLAGAIADGGVAMWCDSPLLDGRARALGYLDVSGWAYCRAGMEGVFIYLNGVRYRAHYGRKRTDLAKQFTEDMRHCGFALTIELGDQQAGRIDVAVVARAADGRAVGMRGEVECHSPLTTSEAVRFEREWPMELLERAEQRQRDAEQMLEALKRSRSWRVTWPLRWIGAVVRHIRGRRAAAAR